VLSGADLKALYGLVYSNEPSIDGSECGDVDGHELVTLRDYVRLAKSVYAGWPAPGCPPGNLPVVPAASSDIEIRYESIFPAGASTVTMTLELTSARSLQALSLPLKILVGGETPTVVPIHTTDRIMWNSSIFRGTNGTVLYGFVNLKLPVQPGTYVLSMLQISASPAVVDRIVTIELIDLPPTMNGQPVNFAMAIDSELNTLLPNLRACPLTNAGDFNNDDVWNSVDIIRLINYVFKGGAEPEPCVAAGDFDCSGKVGSNDIIGLVNFVFRGGESQCDMCPLIEAGVWSCP
jgi:hypothetical protein